jgi:hypothetical protein
VQPASGVIWNRLSKQWAIPVSKKLGLHRLGETRGRHKLLDNNLTCVCVQKELKRLARQQDDSRRHFMRDEMLSSGIVTRRSDIMCVKAMRLERCAL